MLSRIVKFGALAAACAVICCGTAGAVPTVTIGSESLTDLLLSYTSPDSVAPDNSANTYQHVTLTGTATDCPPYACATTDNLASVYRSPYQNINGTTMETGYSGTQFSSVHNGSATYNFAAGTTGVDLLWGSPDTYNTITFFTGASGGGAVMGTYTGSSLTAAGLILGLGHDLVKFTATGDIGSAILYSTQAAFEYNFVTEDNAVIVGTPLPPALMLFGSGLVGLVVLGRRRRRNQALSAA